MRIIIGRYKYLNHNCIIKYYKVIYKLFNINIYMLDIIFIPSDYLNLSININLDIQVLILYYTKSYISHASDSVDI